jgi:myo-inositol-1(or 4)-monophosphatase
MTGNEELLELAVAIATDAGRLAADRRAAGVEVAASKSSLEDVVTFADRETEALIRSRLTDARPGDGFLGEESGSGTGGSGLTWVVDPIDGTVNYLYGIPHYAVSIAVVEGDPDPATWTALAGVVYNPGSGELFTATRGGGAHLGGRRLTVAPPVDLSQALVGTGFGYQAAKREWQAGVVQRLIGRIRDIRRFGTASLDLCAVASGRLNAYYESGLAPWDHAAGGLIAAEAGALVTGGDGRPASSDLIISAHPEVAKTLESVLQEVMN